MVRKPACLSSFVVGIRTLQQMTAEEADYQRPDEVQTSQQLLAEEMMMLGDQTGGCPAQQMPAWTNEFIDLALLHNPPHLTPHRFPVLQSLLGFSSSSYMKYGIRRKAWVEQYNKGIPVSWFD